MKTKDLIIIGIWAFLIITVMGLFIYETEITFASYLLLFFLGVIFSILTLYIPDRIK